jgi:hypothetical protein
MPSHASVATESLSMVSAAAIAPVCGIARRAAASAHFMEQAVAESNFVVVICTPTYAVRANKREGGVGYESMVITSELAEHILTNKFIPVLPKGTWDSSLPIYLKSRMGVDLSDEPYCEDEYEKLLRVLHGLGPVDLANEKHYSVMEIAKLWALSEKTVRRIFEREPGVIQWSREETVHKRGYRTLRVPETVLHRVHRRLRKAS